MNLQSQDMQLYDLMKLGWVSPTIALEKVGCFRLAARVHDLRHKFNVEVDDRWVEGQNGKRWKEYRVHA